MSENKKSKLAGACIVLGLVAFTYIIILNLNLLFWPVGSVLGGGIGSPAVQTETVKPGILSVTLEGFKSVFRNQIVANSLTDNSSLIIPISNVSLSLLKQGTQGPPITGATDSEGEFRTTLPPSTYVLEIQDRRFNNLNATVEVKAGSITHFQGEINQTDIPSSSFNLVDSDASRWIGSWEQVYLYLPVSNSIPTGDSVSTFLAIAYGTAVPYSTLANGSNLTYYQNNISDPSNMIPSRILQDSQSSNSQWVEISPVGLFFINGIEAITLVTQKVSYSVTIGGY